MNDVNGNNDVAQEKAESPRSDRNPNPFCVDRPLFVITVLGVLFVLAVALIFGLDSFMATCMSNTKKVALSGGLFLGLAFLYLFTGEICRTKMTAMVMFCYLITGLALLASVLPFVMGEAFWSQAGDQFEKTPIRVIEACLIEPPNTNLPDEIACGNDGKRHHQWVVSIGGSIILNASTNTQVSSQPAKTAAADASAKLAIPPVTGDCLANNNRHPNCDISENTRVAIEAGLVVPLYVIVLSLMGGAVSMTRRVPEYQRRLNCWYPATGLAAGAGQGDEDAPDCGDGQKALHPTCAREFLVFQMMQVLSAPLLAMTAYFVFPPTTPALSVVLGFIAGFASETILLRIRGLSELLSPVDKLKKNAGDKNPGPSNPGPANPNAGKPTPENPNPATPNPLAQDAGNPEPSTPDPEKPEPDKPATDKAGEGQA